MAQYQGGTEFQPGGILRYVEDLKQGANAEIEPKDIFRSGLEAASKNRILVQYQGGIEFQPGGILRYVEDLKQGANAEIEPKDIF